VACCLALLFVTLYGLAFWVDGYAPHAKEWPLGLVPLACLALGLHLLRRNDGVVVDFAARTLRRGDDCRPLGAAAAVAVTRHIKTSTTGKGGSLHTPYWRVSLCGEGEDLALPPAGGRAVTDLFTEPAANLLLDSMDPLPVWTLAEQLAARLGLPLLVFEEPDGGTVMTPADLSPHLERTFDAVETERPEASERTASITEEPIGTLSFRWVERRLTSLKAAAALVGLLMAVPGIVCVVLAIKRNDGHLLLIPVALYVAFVLLLWGIQLLLPYERTLTVDRSSFRLKTRGGIGQTARLALPEVRAILLAGGDAPGLRIVGRHRVLGCQTEDDAEARWVRWKVLTHLAAPSRGGPSPPAP
jgi:hypothetical protein